MKLQLVSFYIISVLPIIWCSPQLSPRIIDGIPIDKFSRFPHHVSIRTITYLNDESFDSYTGSSYYGHNCSGSIISEKWILTSLKCVYGGLRYRLDFNRLFLNNTEGSFSVLIDNSTVYLYPTEYDDIALIKIPFELEFTTYSSSNKYNLKPISIYNEEEENDNTKHYNQLFAVMPGFTIYKDKLTYGMFRIINNDECKKFYGDKFDEYYQLCTQGWNNNSQVPCKNNEGGGLLIGWPNKPKIIGIFSSPLSCQSHIPAIYTKISKYIDWIESYTGKLYW